MNKRSDHHHPQTKYEKYWKNSVIESEQASSYFENNHSNNNNQPETDLILSLYLWSFWSLVFRFQFLKNRTRRSDHWISDRFESFQFSILSYLQSNFKRLLALLVCLFVCLFVLEFIIDRKQIILIHSSSSSPRPTPMPSSSVSESNSKNRWTI